MNLRDLAVFPEHLCQVRLCGAIGQIPDEQPGSLLDAGHVLDSLDLLHISCKVIAGDGFWAADVTQNP